MVRLEDVCKKGSSGIAQKDLEGINGIYPVFGASGFIKNVDFFQQDKPYIAVVKDGAGVGRVMKLPANSSVIGTMQYIIPNDDINISYLEYALESMNLAKYYTGATIPHIYFKDYRKEILPDYNWNEQCHIAGILDKVSNLIALRKQQLDKLDELVKARFVEMFGDVIRNNMNWPIFLLSDVADSRLGKMLDAKQQTGQYRFPYLANFNVQWFRFEIAELHKMDFDKADQKEFELKDGDLLVCEGGEVGRCAVWHNQVAPCYFQKALHRVRCNLEIIEPNYLSWWFKFHCDYNQFEDIVGSKATIAHLPGAKLKKLEVVVPPVELQRQFSSFIAHIEKCKLTTQQGLDKLEIMKKALMQQYLG